MRNVSLDQGFRCFCYTLVKHAGLWVLLYLGFYCNVIELCYLFQYPKCSSQCLYGFGFKDIVTDPEAIEVSGRSLCGVWLVLQCGNCFSFSFLNTPGINLQTWSEIRWPLWIQRQNSHLLQQNQALQKSLFDYSGIIHIKCISCTEFTPLRGLCP